MLTFIGKWQLLKIGNYLNLLKALHFRLLDDIIGNYVGRGCGVGGRN